jgi:hypothetical protein
MSTIRFEPIGDISTMKKIRARADELLTKSIALQQERRLLEEQEKELNSPTYEQLLMQIHQLLAINHNHKFYPNG